jgi:hypothetical protein
MGAGLVDRRVGHAVVGRDDVVREHPGLDFLAADVGQHVAVDLDARAQHLAALLDHFLPLQRVVDDVAVFVRQVIFFKHGADALAPAAGRFQIGNNLWFVHGHTMPHSKAQGKFFSRAENFLATDETRISIDLIVSLTKIRAWQLTRI